MFGYIMTDPKQLTDEENKLYQASYCGVCASLNKRYGTSSRFVLSHDIAFLSLVLQSAYELDTKKGQEKCLPHPVKKHEFITHELSDYCADMNLVLSYYKLLDDKADDKNLIAGMAAKLYEKHMPALLKKYPRQINAIKECLASLSQMEKNDELNPDLPAQCFGTLMGHIFCPYDDDKARLLYPFGASLGKFIYLMDACCDLKKDIKKKSYNPMVMIPSESFISILTAEISETTKYFDALQLNLNVHILENVLYSGVWLRYKSVSRDNKENAK